MKISLINTTVTLFDSKGNLHLNSSLTKPQVEEVSQLISESITSKSKKATKQIEKKLLDIVSPELKQSKENLKELSKEIKSVKEQMDKISLSKTLSKLFKKTDEGSIVYKGFKGAENVSMPEELLSHMIELDNKGESVMPYVKFWELALANPDKNAREGLFKFVKKQRLIITDNGYIVCYRRAEIHKGEFDDKIEFVLKEITRLRKQKGNLKKYSFWVTDNSTFVTLDHRTKKYQNAILAKAVFKDVELETYYDLAQRYENGNDCQMVLTDNYTKKMRFGLGSVVSIDRNECDSNPDRDCSKGLHIGSRSYVSNGTYFGKASLLCLVNPSKVISVPYSDAHKMRVCEYKIISLFKDFKEIEEFEDSNVKVIDHEYINHEVEEIHNLLSQKTFEKENYSNNAELFLKFAKNVKDLKFASSGLLINDSELDSMRRKIKRRK
jgi:hypothetical protein